jgi:transcriptional regulator with XRE-family HTH domain
MVIGERLRDIREAKNLSQGDIEKRTGLLRCYISRVENGHTVPAMETLEKCARALEIPIYQLFYDGDEPPKAPKVPKLKSDSGGWGSSGKDARTLDRFRRLLSRTTDADREILLSMASQMARRTKS